MNQEILKAFLDRKIILRIGDYKNIIIKELISKNINWVDGDMIEETDIKYLDCDNEYLAIDEEGNLYITEIAM